ncbi:hypothetical protein M3Y94_00674800 [Aphelenchoides besseyi]|nr:hypothetical protein M3Y94_00674800 [Aphelenchoides besseyi]KAI6231376.1 hypothetical protein M3Y95_00375000 [Aphelenchoides besseyi]
MHHRIIFLFLLVLGVSCSPIQDTAQILNDKLTTFFTKAQLVKVLDKIGNDFYIQKPNANITRDAGKKLGELMTDGQRSSFQSMNKKLRSGLGRGYAKVVKDFRKLAGRAFDKNLTTSKKITSNQVKAGKTKVEAINAAWRNADKTMATQIKNGIEAWKKTVTANQWRVIKSSLAKLIRFGLYP